MAMRRVLAAAAVVMVCAVPALGQRVSGAAVGRAPYVSIFNPAGAEAQGRPQRSVAGAFEVVGARNGRFTVGFDPAGLRAAVGEVGAVRIEGFPLGERERVDLDVERFWVTSPGAKFVAGDRLGRDREIAFDPGEVVLLRGRVAGREDSRVYLALSRWVSNGWIDLGPRRGDGDAGVYGVGSRTVGGGQLAAGEVHVFRATAGAAGGRNPTPYCEVHGGKDGDGDRGGGPDGPDGPESGPRRGLRQLELAIETDHDFYRLFDDEQATAAYIVEMYGAMSDVFVREINVRVDLTFARVWPVGNVPFDVGLNGFRSWWQGNMQSVPRDVAQMFSGRGDLPGGVAYLSSICNNGAYGFCGNALGYFADAESYGVLTYDPMVAAHELGHNCGTHHTDTYGIDNCNLVSPTPRRGTIMSYCNQTVSGGLANVDMRFHKIPQQNMLDYLATRACVVADCNQNGVSDALDIAMSVSVDVNANGIPDECEDCNQNMVLDSIDILTGTSFDVNANGIPDECEPDCNGNNIPDRMDITLGTSQDLYGDWKPDECDLDKNQNNISDYNELMADMTLDRNRNALLDAREDCDNDGVPDLVELEGAWDIWVIASMQDRIREYHSVVGVFMNASAPGTVSDAQDLIITADRRILVTSAATNSVVEFDRLGQVVGDLVAPGSGGLSAPAGLMVSPSGTLLVVSRLSNSVLEYDLATGAFLRTLVLPGVLAQPHGICMNPSGTLLVGNTGTHSVSEFDVNTGAFIRTLVAPMSGNLMTPRGMAVSPMGTLLVCNHDQDQVNEYDAATGAFIRELLVTGLPVEGPWSVRIGPDEMVYVSRHHDHADTHQTRAFIFIFDPRLGNFVRAHTQSPDSGLSAPKGFDFMPGDVTDCNRNQLPDTCDIASGFSKDLNNNGVPDECESVCYANCDGSTGAPVLNVADFGCFLTRFAAGDPYANCDGSTSVPVLNVADFGCFLTKFAAGCE